MSTYTCLVLCVLAVSFIGVNAVTEEEKAKIRETFKETLTECSKQHAVSDDDIKNAEQSRNTDGINPCFMGCLFKKTEILNAQGMFDLEKGLSHVKEFLKTDSAKFEEIGHKCVSVNDQAVSDGEAGCERAKLLVTCFLENKGEIPL